MKNLNPTSGAKQLVSGYFCVPRKIVFDLIKGKKIKPSELGYFIILLSSADWDNDPYRKGYIRQELTKLSALWDIPYSTLFDYIKRLKDGNLLISENNAHKINNFENFTSKGAQLYVKEKPTNEYLNNIFTKSENVSEISDNAKAETTTPFRDSSKIGFDVYPKTVVIKQDVRSKEEYERIYIDGDFQGLSVEDMQWIDENIRESIEISDQFMEENIINLYFDGDRNKYSRHLSI
jgi:hypothetical protein